MNVLKKSAVVVSVGTLVACATNTGPTYEMASDERDFGYYETQIGPNRYRVNYNGNLRASGNQVKDMALLRASELTLLNDYEWFRVSSQETEREVSPDVATTTVGTQRVYQSCGLLGCTTNLSPAYSTIQVQRGFGSDRYSTSIEIVMGEGEVEDPTTVYNANELYSFLDDKY